MKNNNSARGVARMARSGDAHDDGRAPHDGDAAHGAENPLA